MKSWEMNYSDEVLNEAKNLASEVTVKSSDDGEIVGEVEGYDVKTYMVCNSPYYPSCNCPSDRPCKHEAALVYHIIDHLELYLKQMDFDEVFDLVSEDDLKGFLLREFESNPDLKNMFFDEFSKKPIDKNYYIKKLDEVFKRGEDREFHLHGFYDLDLMESALYDFIFTDISDVLNAGEYEFACDLLIRIAKLLNDETISTYDSWYGLADRFMEHVYTLSYSIHLDSEKMDELDSNIDHIISVM